MPLIPPASGAKCSDCQKVWRLFPKDDRTKGLFTESMRYNESSASIILTQSASRKEIVGMFSTDLFAAFAVLREIFPSDVSIRRRVATG